MRRYALVLFDLDGTLTDPGVGITNSIIYALRKYGINITDRRELYGFIGPPLTESFEKHFGFSKEKAKEAVEYYREYYRDRGIQETLLYEGIGDLLKTLRERGVPCMVATSKPTVFANQILERFNLAQYFDFVAGSNLDGSRIVKGEVIQYALDSGGISDISAAVMVGDREHDVIGAKKCGLFSIGVLYGYGSREELEAAGATHIAKTVEDIREILLPR